MKITNFIQIIITIFILSTLHAQENKIENENYELNPITIQGTKTRHVQESTATTEITREDVTLHSDVSLDDSLKTVPGINVSMHRKGYVRANLRGFDQSRVAILIDGIPLNDVYSSDIDISNIPVANIEKITVTRGATSALLGTMGEIGVINIITRKPVKAYFESDARYGQYNNFYLNFSHGAPLGNFYYWLTGEIDHSDGYKVSKKLNKSERRKWFDKFIRYDLYGLTYDNVNLPAKVDYINDTGLWDHTEHTRYMISGKAGYEFGRDSETGIMAEYSFKKAKTSTYQHRCLSNYKAGSTGEWEDPVLIIGSEESEVTNAAFRNRSFKWPGIHNFRTSPYLDIAFNDITVKSNVFLTYKKAEQEKYASTDESWPGDEALAGTAYEPFREIKEYISYGVNINPQIDLTNWNTLKFAFLYKYNIYRENNQALSAEESPEIAATLFGTDPFTVQRLESSAFTAAVEDEFSFKDDLNFSIGVSYDAQFFHVFKNREALYQYDDAYIVEKDSKLLGKKDSLNPVFSAMYSPIPDFLILRLAGAIKTRFPNLSEYSKIVDDRRDNRLKPERTYNFSTGFEILRNNKNLSYRCDYFFNRVKDKIEKISGGIDPPVNIGEVRSHGIENILNYKKIKIIKKTDLDLTLSYTWLRARSIDDTPEEKVNKGDYLEFTPEHQICADIKLKFNTGTKVSFWGNALYKQYVYAMKTKPEPNAEFSTGYFKKKRLHDPIKLNLRVSQTLYTNYEVYVMSKNILDDYNADPFIPGPGRMFYVGAKFKL